MRPLVLGEEAVPAVTDPRVARGNPELAVLSALTHGKSEVGLRVVLAGRDAIGALAREGQLDDEHVKNYTDLILAALGRKARAALEAKMALGYEYQSDFAKKYVAEGEAKGRAEGEAKGEAKALLSFLAARKLELSGEERQAILGCKNVAQLDRWIARAASATKAADLFE